MFYIIKYIDNLNIFGNRFDFLLYFQKIYLTKNKQIAEWVLSFYKHAKPRIADRQLLRRPVLHQSL